LRPIEQVQLAHLPRAVERFVTQANARAGKFQAVGHIEAVGGVGQLHRIGRLALRMDFDDRQSAAAQAQGVGVGIERHAFEHHLLAMFDEHLPLPACRRRAGIERLVQGEVDAFLVAADEPGPVPIELAVIGVVLMVLDAWRQADEVAFGLVGIQHPGLAGGLAVEQQDQLALGACTVAMQEEAAIVFLEHQLGAVATQGVPVQAVRTVGLVQLTEEQGLAVIGPGHAAVAIVEGQLDHRAGGQLLDEQAIDLVAAGVQAVGQALMVRADVERAHGQETAACQRVGVQQQLLGVFIDLRRVVGRARAAIVTRVLVACGCAGVIQPRAPGRGERQIGFTDTPFDLLEQLLAQLGLVGQLRLLPGVLGLEVVEHFVAVALLQPGVGIGAGSDASDGGGDGMGHGRLSWRRR
jgi:hypothetical protein